MSGRECGVHRIPHSCLGDASASADAASADATPAHAANDIVADETFGEVLRGAALSNAKGLRTTSAIFMASQRVRAGRCDYVIIGRLPRASGLARNPLDHVVAEAGIDRARRDVHVGSWVVGRHHTHCNEKVKTNRRLSGTIRVRVQP